MPEDITSTVRETCDAPSIMASDLMCRSIGKDSLREGGVVSAGTGPAAADFQGLHDRQAVRRSEDVRLIMGGKWKGCTPPPLPEW